MPGESQKQTPKQGFLGKKFIEEVLQEVSKGIEEAGQGRERSQAKTRLQAVPERVA